MKDFTQLTQLTGYINNNNKYNTGHLKRYKVLKRKKPNRGKTLPGLFHIARRYLKEE